MSGLKFGAVGLYLTAIGALGYDLHANIAHNIQDSLADKVQEVLPNGSRHGAKVTVSGRDIEVSGVLHNAQERQALLAALHGLNGQRTVRMDGIKYLPVATSYRAELKIQDDAISLQTVLPDELAAAQMRGVLSEDVAMDYSLASGLPDEAWPEVLQQAVGLAGQIESGSIILSDRQLTLNGTARSRRAETVIAVFKETLPNGYDLATDDLEIPPVYDVSLIKSADAPVTIAGQLPKDTNLVAFLSELRTASQQDVTLDPDLVVTADGKAGVILAELTRIAPFLQDLTAYTLRISQDAGLVLAGTAKANVDLAAFDAKRQRLGFQTANIDMPEQYDIEFRLDARTGAELAGTAPEGFDPAQVAENLGLPEINLDNLNIGARGDSLMLTDQISSLKPVLQDVETLTVGLEGAEGKAAPKAEVAAETLPNVDPSRIAALLGDLLELSVEPEVAVTKNKYTNGQIRVNGITGIKERYFDGFWMPLLSVTAASADSCRKVTESILKKDQIAFASGRADLDPSARVVINRLAGVVSSCFEQTELNVELAGHTDNQGEAHANMLLSILRVNAVRDALVARGIALARILTVGYGETRPIADNATSEGRRVNRRTEFSWLD